MAYWTGKSKAHFNKQTNWTSKIFTQVLVFSMKALNEIKELDKISLPTAAFKGDTNMFSSEFREGFVLWSLIMAIQ